MRFGHIVTVGTSLSTNDGGAEHGRAQGQQAIVNSLNLKCSCSSYLGSPLDTPSRDTDLRYIVDLLLRMKPQDEFGLRPAQDNMPKDRLPQELSYLWAFANDGYRSECSTKDTVYLLASATDEAKNCATVIRDVLNASPWNQWYRAAFDPCRDFAPGVDARDGPQFSARGFHSWMEKVQEMIECLTPHCDHVYLNVTGGYKATVPYSTLMGMRYGDKVWLTYLFEDSPDIMFVPTYPVGLDFRRWHENALRLRMAREPAAKNYFVPDKPVSNLLEQGKLSAFGRALENDYARQLCEDPLKVYSRNIISRVLNEAGPWPWGAGSSTAGAAPQDWHVSEVVSLRQVLYDLVDKSGDIIWLGDKIPEMVEHAQRHHHDLLEFAELFLTPILCHDPFFLTARERFVLLSALMLHDCGHSLDLLSLKACTELKELFGTATVSGIGDEITLLPNDVRDYHQYLAGIRLNDANMAADLGWPAVRGLEERHLPECLHDAVILACLYHRRRMAYDTETKDQKGKLHLTGQWPGPLKACAAPFRESGVDLMKVVALLRLIDGCDSQARRAGPDARIDLTLSLLQRDYQAAAMRASQAFQAFQEAPDCQERRQWQEAIAPERTDANGCSLPWALNDGDRQKRIAALRCLHDGDAKQKQCARLWLMAAEAADRARLRFGQFDHFMKHRAVREIHVIPDDCFSARNFPFHVVLVLNDSPDAIADPRHPDLRGTIKDFWLSRPLFPNEYGDLEPLRTTIQREVSAEYHQVADYADRHLLPKATYWWIDQWEARCQGGRPFYPPGTG